MTTPNILLISEDENATRLYLDTLSKAGSKVTVAEGILGPRWRELLKQAYNGAVIDIDTAMRAQGPHRKFIHEVAKTCPSVRVKRDPNTPHGFAHSYVGDLGQFIETCRKSPARRLRRFRRVEFHTPVVVTEVVHQGEAFHSLTMDISEGGVFVFCQAERAIGEILEIQFPHLPQTETVTLEVRRTVAWGHPKYIAGFGAEFVRMDVGLRKAIRKLVEKNDAPR